MPMLIVTPIWYNVCKGLFKAEEKNDEIWNINYSKLQYCMGAETCKFGEVTLYPQYLLCEWDVSIYYPVKCCLVLKDSAYLIYNLGEVQFTLNEVIKNGRVYSAGKTKIIPLK